MTIEKNIEVKKSSILYIDDEVNNLNAFKASFRREYEITLCGSPLEAYEILKNQTFELIITDQRMPEMNGTDFLASILKFYPETMRILLTGYADINAVIAAINKGEIYRYVTKPWKENELRGVISSAFEVYSLRKENKLLTQSLLKANEQLEFMLRQKLLS